jgi:hypothetical protein
MRIASWGAHVRILLRLCNSALAALFHMLPVPVWLLISLTQSLLFLWLCCFMISL